MPVRWWTKPPTPLVSVGLDQLAELADDPTLWRDLDRPDLNDLIRQPLRATGVTGGRELKVKDGIACVGAAVV